MILLDVSLFVSMPMNIDTHCILTVSNSEYDSPEQVFVNAYPWLFPGGIGDVYDPIRGKVKDIYEWAKHLLRFHAGRF